MTGSLQIFQPRRLEPTDAPGIARLTAVDAVVSGDETAPNYVKGMLNKVRVPG